jgi:predicted nucleotide-binding protein
MSSSPNKTRLDAALATIDECLRLLKTVADLDQDLDSLGRAIGPLNIWLNNALKLLNAAGLVSGATELRRLRVLSPPDPALAVSYWIDGYRKFLVDLKRMVMQSPSLLDWENPVAPSDSAADRRSVAVVYGRNEAARAGLFYTLHALGLAPLEWGEALAKTGSATPYTGETVDMLFTQVQAVVVLLTGDEEVRLREPLWKSPEDGKPGVQARPNVFFEAGIAFAKYPRRTLLVQIGTHRDVSDFAGRHVVHFTGDAKTRNDLRNRLETAGCVVKAVGNDWLEAGQSEIEKALRT